MADQTPTPQPRHFRESATPTDWLPEEGRPPGHILGDCVCGHSYLVPAGADEGNLLDDAQEAHEAAVGGQPQPDTPTDPEDWREDLYRRVRGLQEETFAEAIAAGLRPTKEQRVAYGSALEDVVEVLADFPFPAGVRGEPNTTPTGADGWQPGDSAPRDGRDIEGRWNDPEAPDLVIAWTGRHWQWDGCATEEPDFWRPLGGGRR